MLKLKKRKPSLFVFSPTITTICLALAILMALASRWQWNRYIYKQKLIQELKTRLAKPVVDIKDLLKSNSNINWEDLSYRRVKIEGELLFNYQMGLKNRRLGKEPGGHLLTPIKINTGNGYIYAIVDRGFIPLDYFLVKEKWKLFSKEKKASFIALIKKGEREKFLAPKDPSTGKEMPFAYYWLRVNLKKIKKQLPFKILPVYFEKIPENADTTILMQQMESKGNEREEILTLIGKDKNPVAKGGLDPNKEYPIATPNTYVPPGRHFSYVFEWIFMAIGTLLIGFILQLKRTI